MTPSGERPIVLGVPAYLPPAGAHADWARLAHAPVGSLVVVRPSGGPSGPVRRDYGAAVAAARRRGCLVYGHLDSAYGTRGARDLGREARHYRAELGVDGVFVDRAGGDPDALAALDGLAAAARRWGLRIAVDPGHPQVPDDVFDRFDEVVLFEGPLEVYADLPGLVAARGEGRPGRAWHLVYGVASEAEMQAVVSVAAWRGAEVIFVTDRSPPDPWGALPHYWDREIDAVRRASAPSILP